MDDVAIFESRRKQRLRIHRLNLTFRTEPMMAFPAFDMMPDVVIMIVMSHAATAQEGLIEKLVLRFRTCTVLILRLMVLKINTLLHFLVVDKPRIKRLPYACEFYKGTECRTLQFVEIVVEFIRVL